MLQDYTRSEVFAARLYSFLFINHRCIERRISGIALNEQPRQGFELISFNWGGKFMWTFEQELSSEGVTLVCTSFASFGVPLGTLVIDGNWHPLLFNCKMQLKLVRKAFQFGNRTGSTPFQAQKEGRVGRQYLRKEVLFYHDAYFT